MSKVSYISSMLDFSPTVAQFGHEMRAEYLKSTGLFTVPFLFWTNVMRRYPGASVRMGHRRIQWRKRTELA
jgi:hypothetical protein